MRRGEGSEPRQSKVTKSASEGAGSGNHNVDAAAAEAGGAGERGLRERGGAQWERYGLGSMPGGASE